MKIDFLEEIKIPEKVQVLIDEKIAVKGPKGEVQRRFADKKISLKVKEGKVVVESKNGTKREKSRLYSLISHIKNMLKGVTESYQYEMKICSGHFPMNIAVVGNELVVKNFLGESNPRKLKIAENVKVKVEGDHIKIESPDVEAAGRTASDIEILVKIPHRDRRVFQDGIYIISKPQ